MENKFNKKDLISFGKYLLSDERAERIVRNPGENALPDQDRFTTVTHADFQNWKAKQ